MVSCRLLWSVPNRRTLLHRDNKRKSCFFLFNIIKVVQGNKDSTKSFAASSLTINAYLSAPLVIITIQS